MDSSSSISRSVLGKLNGAAKVILPKRLYERFFNVAYATYRGLLRILYFRHAIYFWSKGDLENYGKARLVQRAMRYSLVGNSGLEATYDVAVTVGIANIGGSFVECGVAQGGCSALMATLAAACKPRRKMWLFDSFEGLPSPTQQDYDDCGSSTGTHIHTLGEGSCLGTLDQVERVLFSDFRLDRKDVFLIKGWFQDTLPEYRKQIGAISVLRVDGDWYESTKCCLENLYDNVVSGGFLIIDDYGTCHGCKKAVDEFIQRRGLNVQFFSDGRGGVKFEKPESIDPPIRR